MNADALGYAKSTTYPGTGTPGNSEGGGHMGRGGLWDQGLVGGTFGSVYHPLEAGGGGQVGDVNYAQGTGGGIVRVIGTSVTVDGTVRANAQEPAPVATWGSGAGGSVYITTSKLAGNGVLQANGATWSGASPQNRGAGGGGAVAVEYSSVSGGIVSNLTALGGAADQASHQAAAGTTFAKSAAGQYGDLVVSNGTRSSSLPSYVVTDLPSFGISSVTSVPAAGVAVTDASWIGPYFIGHPVRVTAPDGTIRGTWHVTAVANDASVRRGVQRLSHVLRQRLRNRGHQLAHRGRPQQLRHLAVRHRRGVYQLHARGGRQTLRVVYEEHHGRHDDAAVRLQRRVPASQRFAVDRPRARRSADERDAPDEQHLPARSADRVEQLLLPRP
jgi:hypothetical protein